MVKIRTKQFRFVNKGEVEETIASLRKRGLTSPAILREVKRYSDDPTHYDFKEDYGRK